MLERINKALHKKVRYYDYLVWAVNPAVFSKCKFVPFWLYEEFKTYMMPFLSATTIKKLESKIDNQYN